MEKKYEKILIIFTILLSIVLVMTSVKYGSMVKPKAYFEQEFVEGVIVEVIEEKIVKDPIVSGRYMGTQKLRVKILEGSEKDNEFVINNTLSKRHNIKGTKGLKAIFTVREKNGKNIVWLYNYDRRSVIHLLVFSFLLLIVILGGIKGLKSILSLIFTSIMLIFVLIPLLFAGYEPIPISILVTTVIIFVSFSLIGGINKKTFDAIVGTIFGVVTAGLLSYIFGRLANLSGVNMENGEQVLYIATDYQIKIKGLMFISILISSLGAIMDVAMSISSAGSELVSRSEDISPKELFISLMNIGRDIMGTMTNTLILAFGGSSLTLIMMIWGYQMPYKQFINIPLIGIEAIQAFAGSIGIILTVPFTALITTVSLKHKRRRIDEK